MTQYKAKELIKLLKKAGFVEKGITGDHHKFAKRGHRPIIVPYSHLGDTVHVGTYKAILGQIKRASK